MTDTIATRSGPVTWNRRPGYEDIITTDEGREGKEAFLDKRKPDFSRFKRYP
jgi:hypothetical protein